MRRNLKRNIVIAAVLVFVGAVVCQGADAGSVRLAVTEAVRCYTGLGADRIEIFKMNESEG